MNRTLVQKALVLGWFGAALFSLGSVTTGSLRANAEEGAAVGAEDIGMAIGGTGGVYFLAEPGELVIDLVKRDRRRGRRTELRAILVGPDRRVLQEVILRDDSKPQGKGIGPPQHARLAVPVERKGVYGMNVTISTDRYGDKAYWGFRTNCPRYLIETARGHRDRRREEPIVLANPESSGEVCFLPRKGAFGMEISGLPKGGDPLTVTDADGTLTGTLSVDEQGKASHTFAAGVHREAVPWRLHLPKQQATIQIDGVTRWESGDLYENLPNWSPDSTSFFPLQAYRWLLTPYQRTMHGKPGEKEARASFRVHNNSDGKRTIRVQIEFPNNPWPIGPLEQQIELAPGRSREIALEYTVPPGDRKGVCHVRATPVEDPEFSTYSTLTVFGAGAATPSRTLDIPLVLKPYEHENEQFGYVPDFPVESQMYFDQKNRPFVRTGGGVATLREGKWATSELRTAVTSRAPPFEGTGFGMTTPKVAFDEAGDVYLLATTGPNVALLRSTDGGTTFSAHRIPGRKEGRGAFDFEQCSGNNTPEGPPPILRYTRTAVDPRVFWRRIHDLELFVPKKGEKGISLGEPILITKNCIGLASHSGCPSTVVSRGDKIHVIWAEATDPKIKVPGVPTFVVTYDCRTKRLGEPALVGYGAPPNDIHNSPSITIDPEGYLHALAGTHGQPFQYARSLVPNDAHSGWTKAEPVGEGLRQTYIGFVCGPDGTLHLVFRLWWYGAEPHPASHHATLAYQRKRPGQPWEKPRVLIVPPFSEYSVFYHRLTIDRLGRLFLSYDYWSTYWFYRMDHRGSRRAMMMSPDGGQSWKLVQTSDIQ